MSDLPSTNLPEPSSHPEDTNSLSPDSQKQLTPLRCLVGAIIAAVLAYACYSMASSIAGTFAAKPIQTDNLIVQRISAAVRTLVVGLTALGMGTFSLATLGLLGLAVQLLLKSGSSSLPKT